MTWPELPSFKRNLHARLFCCLPALVSLASLVPPGLTSTRVSKVAGAVEGGPSLVPSPPKPPPNPLRQLPGIASVLQHMDALLCQNLHMSKLLSSLNVSLWPEATCLEDRQHSACRARSSAAPKICCFEAYGMHAVHGHTVCTYVMHACMLLPMKLYACLPCRGRIYQDASRTTTDWV